MSTRPIRFFHQGRLVALDSVPPTRTVLEWLREDAHCTGTKEGCAEGDCGACMVVLGERGPDGGPQWRPVNACIQFVPQLDGRVLYTVEDVSGPGGALHPVQQAMVECHGSQCGFCTPGFVMSLWALYQEHLAAGTRPDREAVIDALSGNLCRCTGYRPILEAAQRMFEAPPVLADASALAQALDALRSEAPLQLDGQGTRFHAPRRLPDLADLVLQHPQATLLAGSTDIGLWVTKQFRPLPELISVGEVAELKRIEVAEGGLVIGAAASLEAAWQALAAHWPGLASVWRRFASRPLRRAGTMGGNVANGSPIGDSAPVLMALDAQVRLRRGERVRVLPLEGFYTGYMRNQLEAGEFLEAIEVPLPGPGDAAGLRAYKLSKRHDCDISAVCAGMWLRLDGPTVADARIAFGGMAATVCRAHHAEAAMRGQPWTAATAQAAAAALAQDYRPMSDMRASAAYRLQGAQGLLQRWWLETQPDGQALPRGQVDVWAAA